MSGMLIFYLGGLSQGRETAGGHKVKTPTEYLESLERIRKEKDMNITIFAQQELGMSKATYYRWKEGKMPKSFEFYRRIEEYLKNYNL